MSQLGGEDTADIEDEDEEEEEEEVVAPTSKKVVHFASRHEPRLMTKSKKKNKKKKKKTAVVPVSDDDDEEEETSSKQTPRKGRKAAGKVEEMDEVDKALAELNIKCVELVCCREGTDRRYGSSEAEQAKAPTAGPSESKGFMAFR